VDPVVIFKMSLLGYLYKIRSERKLAEKCRLNLAFMWDLALRGLWTRNFFPG